MFTVYLSCVYTILWLLLLLDLVTYCFVTSGVHFLLKNDPFILKHYSLIVTVLVYDVPGIEVSVLIWKIIILSGYYFKRLISRLLTCL